MSQILINKKKELLQGKTASVLSGDMEETDVVMLWELKQRFFWV